MLQSWIHETPAEAATIPSKDVQTALASLPTETDTSAVVTGPGLYVNIPRLKYQTLFANMYSLNRSSAKVESGQKFKTVAGARAAVASRAEPNVRRRTGCGDNEVNGILANRTMEAAWNDSTSTTRLLAVFWNLTQYYVTRFELRVNIYSSLIYG